MGMMTVVDSCAPVILVNVRLQASMACIQAAEINLQHSRHLSFTFLRECASGLTSSFTFLRQCASSFTFLRECASGLT
jgi:accessory gene regulator protein AgrB